MLDHDGTVEVAEQGGIFYRFEGLRRTADDASAAESAMRRSAQRVVRAAWETPVTVPPLTANPGASNVAIAALNGFNLLASLWAIANDMTIHNLVTRLTTHLPPGAPPLVLPYDGIPVVLGVVPLVFSVALFALPALRALGRTRAERKAREENARLGILREVLTRAPKKQPVTDESLRVAYRVATGVDPTSKEITRRVVDLGGDVDVGPAGEVRYRFADLEAEAEALEDDRAHAGEGEAKLGRIVFASDD
jgi:hypothetical protein